MTDISMYEILADIEFTKKELKAYSMLGEGFKILSELPENRGSSDRLYMVKSEKYWKSQDECNEFLRKLCNLRDKRIEEE